MRFEKTDLEELLNALRFPDKFVCSQRTVCSGMEGLCILLKRLAFPCRYTDMVLRFGRNPTELCLIFNHVLNYVYQTNQHRLLKRLKINVNAGRELCACLKNKWFGRGPTCHFCFNFSKFVGCIFLYDKLR